MPLKHATETLLVFVLGVVLALTGLLCATLPPFPEGLLPWSFLLAAALLYPIALGPLFRKRRADYGFRLLHWFPALVLILWMSIDTLSYAFGFSLGWITWFTWGWTLPVITLGFILLGFFCLRVLRRWTARLALLALIFVPYAVLGMISAQGPHFEREIGAALWQGDWWSSELVASLVSRDPRRELAQAPLQQPNLDASHDVEEEQWRERLRAVEQRRRELLNEQEGKILVDTETTASEDASSSSEIPVFVAQVEPALSGTGNEIREAETLPAHLPQSGGPLGIFGVITVAGYFGTLHDRMRRRA